MSSLSHLSQRSNPVRSTRPHPSPPMCIKRLSMVGVNLKNVTWPFEKGYAHRSSSFSVSKIVKACEKVSSLSENLFQSLKVNNYVFQFGYQSLVYGVDVTIFWGRDLILKGLQVMLIDVTMKTAEFDVWMRMLICSAAAVFSSESRCSDDEQSGCLPFTADSSLTLLIYLRLGQKLDPKVKIDQNELSVVIIKLRVFFSSYIFRLTYMFVDVKRYKTQKSSKLHLLQLSFKTADNDPSFFKLCPTVSVKERTQTGPRFFNTATKWYSALASHVVSIHQFTHTYITLFRVVGLESANINKGHLQVKCKEHWTDASMTYISKQDWPLLFLMPVTWLDSDISRSDKHVTNCWLLCLYNAISCKYCSNCLNVLSPYYYLSILLLFPVSITKSSRCSIVSDHFF